jgi:hypothetical protein
VRLRQRLLLEFSEPSVPRWSSEVSGDAAASATDARRTSGCCCWSSGSLPNARRRAPPTASASGTHNWSQRFIAVLLVLVRQMRTRKVGLAARRHAVTARVAALKAHWHTTAARIAATCTCRAVRASLFLLDDD